MIALVRPFLQIQSHIAKQLIHYNCIAVIILKLLLHALYVASNVFLLSTNV